MQGFKKVFSGENVLPRQICLFSVCGVVGLINGYFALYSQHINDMPPFVKLGFFALLLLAELFFVGYEILFLKERELPDFDLRSFNIALQKVPFVVFLLNIPALFLGLFFSNNFSYVFILQVLLAIPLTMMQVGFSFNFCNEDFGLLFKRFTVKDYLVLLLKLVGVMGLAYILSMVAIFCIFMIGGIIFALVQKTDATNFVMIVSANQHVIAKLANYLMGIILTYFTMVAALSWDFEVLVTYEKDLNK